MGPMGASLREDIERRPKGPVRAELERTAVHEGAVGENHLVPVAGCHAWHCGRRTTANSQTDVRLQSGKRGSAQRKSDGVALLLYAVGAVHGLTLNSTGNRGDLRTNDNKKVNAGLSGKRRCCHCCCCFHM